MTNGGAVAAVVEGGGAAAEAAAVWVVVAAVHAAADGEPRTLRAESHGAASQLLPLLKLQRQKGVAVDRTNQD